MAIHDSAPTKKRKNPPAFRHLPQNRAQKLKKAWLEKGKIKAQWRAQKRKEGLLVDSRRSYGGVGSGFERQKTKTTSLDGHGHDEDEDEEGSQSGASSSTSTHYPDADGGDEGDLQPEPRLPRKKARTTIPHISESHSQRSNSRSGKSKGKNPTHLSIKDDELSRTKTSKSDEHGSEGTSLRELTRRAYAPSSLHTFKSDPLHRRKDSFTKERTPKPSGPTSSLHSTSHSEGKRHDRFGQERFGQGRQPRGQPNMKLRMEAMLERIKRDYS